MNDSMPLTMPARRNVFDRPDVLSLTRRQSDFVLPVLVVFIDKHRPRVGLILMGEVRDNWTNRDLRRLESIVLNEAEDPRQVWDFLRVLRKACAFWAMRERSPLALPRIPMLTPCPRNPLRFDIQKQLARYAAWKRTLATLISEEAAIASGNQEQEHSPDIELVIVSAILYGGLINATSIVALIRAVPDIAIRTIGVDGRIHAETSLPWRGIQGMEFRRSEPDALTDVLWSRTRPDAAADLLMPEPDSPPGSHLTDKQLRKRLALLIHLKFKRSAGNDWRLLGGLNALIRAAQTVAHLEMPGVIAAYAARSLVSHSLPRSTLRRVSKEDLLFLSEDSLPAQALPLDTAGVFRCECSNSTDLEPTWLQELRASMTGKDRATIRLTLSSLSNQSSFAKRMMDFGDSLLAMRATTGKMLSVSSARGLVQVVARHMGRFLSDQDPAELDTESLESVYAQMMESCGQLSERRDNQDSLARGLYEFHRYMIARHGKEPIQSRSLLMQSGGLARVEANLVTFEEYETVLKSLDLEWPITDPQQRPRIARILVILGFRCGLRRLEALHCRMQDILLYRDGRVIELLVRPFGLFKLKSRNAIRRIPQRLLLTAAELEEVKSWLETRIDQGAKPTDFVFGNAEENLAIVPQTIFNQINQIIRQVTGDNTLHFHHLRHSFATWIFLSLILADMDNPPDLFPHLKQTTAWLRGGSSLRLALYRNCFETRKYPYLIAMLLGHGSPGTSMQHYVHLLDFLLAAFLERSTIMRPDCALVAKASGIKRTTLQPLRQSADVLAIPFYLLKKRAGKQSALKTTKANLKNPVILNAPAGRPTASWIYATWNFLCAAQRSRRPFEEVLSQFSLDRSRANHLLDQARYIHELPSGHLARRHRMEQSNTNHLQERDPLTCPDRPNQSEDKAVVERFSAKLSQAASLDADRVRRALYCYAHRAWRSRGLVVFHSHSDAADARNYVEFLRGLGVLRKDIRWFTFDSHERSEAVASWKVFLELNRHNKVERINAPNNASVAAESWFGIMPRFHFGDVATDDVKNPGTFGFRFLMIMGFIAFG